MKGVYVGRRTADHLGPRGRPPHQAQPLPDAPFYPQAHRGAGSLARTHPRHRGRRGRERPHVSPVPVQVKSTLPCGQLSARFGPFQGPRLSAFQLLLLAERADKAPGEASVLKNIRAGEAALPWRTVTDPVCGFFKPAESCRDYCPSDSSLLLEAQQLQTTWYHFSRASRYAFPDHIVDRPEILYHIK